jgi:nicotinate phosphoribosyltransferase
MNRNPENQYSIPALFTDLYEITMAAAFWQNRIDTTATFDLFFRILPARRNYFIAAGIETAINYVLNLRFTNHEIEYLKSLKIFESISGDFFEYLSDLKFSGTIKAMPEGTFVFPSEPVLEITAPIIEAQILETALLSVINFETMVASKAARVVQAAQGRSVIEFGARRAHGPGAAVAGARAACAAGCTGTSNLQAGMMYNLPVYGTVAHSFIMAYDDEIKAFEDFAKTFPGNVVLLIDTYDTIEGARNAVKLGNRVKAVRLDSGNILTLSKKVREILNDAGMHDTRIMASGDLNETIIRDLVDADAPVDIFGVGSELITSKDAPTMSGVYKLVETREPGNVHYRIKLSEHKMTLPGQKEVFRVRNSDGIYVKDVIAEDGELEKSDFQAPLMKTYVKNGKLIEDFPPVMHVAERINKGRKYFSPEILDLISETRYPVELSPRMDELLKIARKEHEE